MNLRRRPSRPSPDAAVGSVAWHRALARNARRGERVMALSALLQCGLLVDPWSQWFVRIVNAALFALFVVLADRWHLRARRYDLAAWEAETTTVVAGMASSGVFTLDDAAEFLRGSPMPGLGRKARKAWAVAEVQLGHEGDA